MAHGSDREMVRDLVRRYMAAATEPVMDERRALWRAINDLQPGRPAVHVRGGRVWQEVPELQALRSSDPFWRGLEYQYRFQLYRMSLGDDTIFEPWHAVRPAFTCTGWGLSGEVHRPTEDRGAWKMDHPLTDLDDLSGLQEVHHAIDETATAENRARVEEAIGDLIPVCLDRSPAYQVWSADLSTDLGRLRGIESFMMDMYDNPEGLHRLLAFLRDGVLRVHEEADAAGDWCLTAHENQVMCYGGGLADPAPGVPAAQNELWGYMAAQEYTLVSPAMHEEFLLQYQRPILARYGQVAYGCCEDLTDKIDMLRTIPNLRRIAVTPVADVARCAAQIGTDYAISYRPNPADMVCCGYSEELIRKVIGGALQAMPGLCFDITLKDIDTCQGEPDRLRRWVALVRQMVEEHCCLRA